MAAPAAPVASAAFVSAAFVSAALGVAALGVAAFVAVFLAFPGSGGFFADFRFALPFGVLAPAVLRLPPLLAAMARDPPPAFRVDGVRFCPLRFPLVFFAMTAL